MTCAHCPSRQCPVVQKTVPKICNDRHFRGTEHPRGGVCLAQMPEQREGHSRRQHGESCVPFRNRDTQNDLSEF